MRSKSSAAQRSFFGRFSWETGTEYVKHYSDMCKHYTTYTRLKPQENQETGHFYSIYSL